MILKNNYTNTLMFTASSLVFAIAALCISSCADERDSVDRVQPYALDKSFFIGENFSDTRDDPEFYARNHVVDVGYGADGAATSALFTSTYTEAAARIKWQITENYLIARLAYERISGSDGKGEPKIDLRGNAVGSATNDGIAIAMFSIDSHFDIVNEYNPTTGEKLNVVVENDKDRPWYERRYMRVDWSKNLHTDSYDFDTLSAMGIYGGVEYEPISFYVEDPNDEQSPHFETDKGYFDITTKVFAKPLEIDLSKFGWGMKSIPACYLPQEFFGGSAPSGSCNPVEITLRHSFSKIQKNKEGFELSDYEPIDYDGKRFEMFGGFYTEKYGYARNFGMTDAQWHRMLNRYNIWEQSHYWRNPKEMTDPIYCSSNIDANNNGTADECEHVTDLSGFAGSQCSMFKGICTLPYRSRTAKPIAFYYTDTGNPDYFEPSELAVHQWDVALRSAVQTARYVECIRTVELDTKLPTDWNSWIPDADSNLTPIQQIEKLKEEYSADRRGPDEICKRKYPVWTGQMDDQIDAAELALDIDDCRNGRAYQSETDCMDLLNRLADMRGIAPDLEKHKNGVREIARMEEMLVLCHSPVLHSDPDICGKDRLAKGADVNLCTLAKNLLPGENLPSEIKGVIEQNDYLSSLDDFIADCDKALRVRHGDLRYHVINVVDKPQKLSPWGIMMTSTDPVTGENIATNCNVWSHITDLLSQKVVDQMRLIKGELTFEDITEASNVADWVEAAEAASRDGVLGTIDRKELSSRISNFVTNQTDPDFLDKLKENNHARSSLSSTAIDAAKAAQKEMLSTRADSSIVSSGSAVIEARRKAAQNTTFEASLMTDAVLQKHGATGLAGSEFAAEIASPLRGGNPAFHRDMKRMMENSLHKKGMCILDAEKAEDTPTALAPLADRIEEKFGAFNRDDPVELQLERAAKVHRYLAQKIHFGVIAHEIGHSIAHRHNFVGSSDAWSYWPQYWQLRTKDGSVSAQCTGKETDGENCVGPRYVDPVTDEERDNFIHMFSSSSVMDYPGEITHDFLPPGIFDFAATRMFYGDVVSVIDEPLFYQPTSQDKSDGPKMLYSKPLGAAEKIDARFGGLIGIQYGDHYSQIQNMYGMLKPDTCRAINAPKAFRPGRYNAEEAGEWHPLLDGRIVAPDGTNYTKCRQPQVDYVSWSMLSVPRYPVSMYDAEAGSLKDSRLWDYKDRVLAPYSFATDSWADLGNVSVYRHDSGADLYEIFNYLITEKEMSYIFDKFRRGRSDFSIKSAANRSMYRYDEKIKEGAKSLAFYKNFISQYSAAVGAAPDKLLVDILTYWWSGHIESNILAVTYAFDFFARQLARPQPGAHGYARLDDDYVLRSTSDPGWFSIPRTYVSIPNGPSSYWGAMNPGGELLENQLASDMGEFDRDYTLNCGSYYDKANASMLLTESVDNFISSSRTDFHDPRFRSSSLADLFPDGYRRLIGNALTNDEFLKGPRLSVDSSLVPLVDSEGYPAQGIGWTSWWPNTPTHCFPADGRNACGDFLSDEYTGNIPQYTVPVDSQIGWEQQKFIIAWTLLYLPENQKQDWLNQLRIYEQGRDAEPEFTNRIELHHPSAPIYIARTYGKENLFGRTVQKGIAARVLEYANSLLVKAYETTEVDIDLDGVVDWYEPVLQSDGRPIVLFDRRYDAEYADDPSQCNADNNSGCTCEENRACTLLKDYLSVPSYLRQAMDAYAMLGPSSVGIWN